MTNRNQMMLLIAVFALGGYYLFNTPTPSPPVGVTEIAQPQPEAPEMTPKLKLNAATVKQARGIQLSGKSAEVSQFLPSEVPQGKVNPRYTNKPSDMTVEFEEIDGQAVAFGDTIIGNLSKDFTEKKGITEMFIPKYWDKGIVPYAIQATAPHQDMIQQAIDYFNKNTSIKFVPYTGQDDAIVFVKGEEHCLSYLGRTGGTQPIYISGLCGTHEILHELMHALGFVHEQSRPDRDQYVDIFWNQIQEKYQAQFAMVPEVFMQSYFGSPFDAGSIMMYSSHAFGVSPEAVTLKLKNGQEVKQSAGGLSSSDMERVNRLYQN